MNRFFSGIAVLGFIVLAIILAVMSIGWSRGRVTNALEEEGYKDIDLSIAWINRAPIQCAGKNVPIYTYSATLNGQKVTGFACNQGWPWSVKHWDD